MCQFPIDGAKAEVKTDISRNPHHSRKQWYWREYVSSLATNPKTRLVVVYRVPLTIVQRNLCFYQRDLAKRRESRFQMLRLRKVIDVRPFV